eukprot:8756135-Ditylum_brightwellii.AAC.1
MSVAGTQASTAFVTRNNGDISQASSFTTLAYEGMNGPIPGEIFGTYVTPSQQQSDVDEKNGSM